MAPGGGVRGRGERAGGPHASVLCHMASVVCSTCLINRHTKNTMGGNKENEEVILSTQNRNFAIPPPSPIVIPSNVSSPVISLSPPPLVRSRAEPLPERRLTLGSRVYTEEERQRLLDLYNNRVLDVRVRPLSRRRGIRRRVLEEVFVPLGTLVESSSEGFVTLDELSCKEE